ncbi:XkdF-like putative serine protease domain-containing protein [Halobellus sp. H-GB7]|uniref:XkdF-like putative serine protease domain-containing protein n=1 Tax=Halobellus sp. H-GB7 TaxID=3069756 RepID=UPI0027B388F8|nr:XkdF-like putative serine protease domain-containing protein [Halobellus sp. H-GB7]MDQ2053242.1 XkdF-like putative serine protease domain-containing protein [Halobellus sp. H-GB7]
MTDETAPRRFTKTATIKAVDEEARTATGAVLVPDELDHQGDFLRPEAIRRFHSDDVATGVMHSAFPDDAAALERSEVIDTAEELDGATYPPGTWIATRRYDDDDLWQLVEDGILTGFSIGGEVSEAVEHEELPDEVTVPDAVEHEDAGGIELVDGSVDEVSDVDIPAVPRATYKGDLAKGVLEEIDGEDEFVAVMTEQRGHDEADARQLYQYLSEHTDADDPDGDSDAENTATHATEVSDAMTDPDHEDEPATDKTPADPQVDDATLGKRLKTLLGLGGADADATADDGTQATAKSEALDTETTDAPATDDTEKAGRTLSTSNVDAVKAIHDASIDLLSQADGCETALRYTDREDDDFEMAAYGADSPSGEAGGSGEDDEDVNENDDEDEESTKTADDGAVTAARGTLEKELTPEQATIVADAVEEFVDAHGDATVGDFRDWFWEMDWADELDPDQIVALESAFDEWFDAMAAEEQVITDQFADWLGEQAEDTELTMSNDPEDPPAWAATLTEKVDSIEKRVSEMEDDEDAEKSLEDAPEWAANLAEKVDDLDERVETISKQSGHSQQLGKTADEEEETEKSNFTLDPRKAGR